MMICSIQIAKKQRRLTLLLAAAVLVVAALAQNMSPAAAQGPKAKPAAKTTTGSTPPAASGGTITGAPNALQGFSQNRDKPIQIDAATLEVRDKDKIATFSGDVKVVQGDTTMRSKVLVVYYDQEATPAAGAKSGAGKSAQAAVPGPGGSSQIRRLEAKGNVVVNQKDQTVTGANGIFDMKANTVTMIGGVVLTTGDNVLRGEKLSVDLTTGVSRVDPGQGGRVQGVFKSSPQNGPADGSKPGLLNGFSGSKPK
jgi:lipopolysaccharide export system protein LptA